MLDLMDLDPDPGSVLTMNTGDETVDTNFFENFERNCSGV